MLLAHPFRIFFLATAVYAGFVVFAWIAFLFAGWPLPLGWAPLQWHSHEMLYGFVSAAIAGFMLTAMTNWTGARPLQGAGLLALLLVWLAGRVVMWVAAWLPGWLVSIVDLAFLPVLAIYVSSVLLRHHNRRNFVLVAVLTFLTMGNLTMQIGFLSGEIGLLKKGELLGFDLISVLIVIIAGRIIPAFTANWLRMQGHNAEAVKTFRWLEILSLASVVSILVVDGFNIPGIWIGIAAIFAGSIHALRLAAWAGLKTRREPLLWILHLAYLWIVIALFLRGASYFTEAVSPSLWQHAMGVGGIATLILGVMTRVAVGHTGRPLRLLRFGLLIYLAITAAALLRISVAMEIMNFHIGVSLSAIAWVVAFSLFMIIYGPILASPRADGKPG